MQVRRLFGVAAVLLRGVCAGTMDSRKGRAIVTPAPLRKVRLERCFLEMTVMTVSSGRLFHHHLERCALNNAENDRRKMIIVASRLINNGSDRGHVIVMYCTAHGVR